MLARISAQFEIACPVLQKDQQFSPRGAEDTKIDVTGDFRPGKPPAGSEPPDAVGTKDTVDDITIWVHPTERTRSVVVGADHGNSTVEGSAAPTTSR